MSGEGVEVAYGRRPVRAARTRGKRRRGLTAVLFFASVAAVQGAWLAVLAYLAFRFL